MSSRTRVVLAFTLLAIAGGARILLQLAATPPYAGLDEIYHVARVNFVLNEHRNPTAREPSVASYLHESLALEEGVLPDFVKAAPQWQKMVASGYRLPASAPVAKEKRTTYLTSNYQAQQASLYYWIAAPVVSVFSDGSRISELRTLRLFSALFAWIAILATGLIGFTLAGVRGVAASSILFLFPTWQTLMIRASNDALAVSALAVALWLTILGSRRLLTVEAVVWSVALMAKLFTWPALIVLPIVWRQQRAGKTRIAIVSLLCLTAIVGTSLELRSRTGVAVGLEAFNEPSAERAAEQPIAYGEMVKITISSAIWMSGQHNNALTAKGMALYVLPPFVATMLLLVLAPPKGEQRIWAFVAIAALGAFALAQVFHASAHIRNAKLLGEVLPAAGKEGWYWFALASLVIGTVLAPLFRRVRCAFLALAIGWLLIWDMLITEGALFRDYAGLTSPASPAMLFRWGPAPVLSLELSHALDGLVVGPLAGWIVVLRASSIIGLFVLVVVACRGSEELLREPNSVPEPALSTPQ